ncbi:MAG: leucine-rich repeat domain-containing protein [Clostridia bacterium]|nr:leucine-rich repeat domain-containing protein [Clostridia bacterium]
MNFSVKTTNRAIRIAAAVVCAIMIACMLPTSVFALEGTTGELTWRLWGGTLTVSGKGSMPEYSDDFMPPWYDSATAINKINVGEGVTNISSLAFYGCTTASVIKLPSTVTSIGDRAFKNCGSLKYLNLPDNLTYIGEAAFEECTKLNGVVLPNGLTTVDHYAFMRCTSLSSIVIPASVENLGMVVFAYCTGLTQAQIRCPITKVPDWTFYGCTSLSAISLPSTISEAGPLAFHDCPNLDGVYYSGDSLETIENIISSDPTTGQAVIIDNNVPTEIVEGEEEGGQSGGNSNTVNGTNDGKTSANTTDGDTGNSIITTVSDTDDAVITVRQETEYDYTVNGMDATYDDVINSGENDSIDVKGYTTNTIDASIITEDGWDDLEQVVNETVKTNDADNGDNPVRVNVQLDESVVSGSDLGKFAGKDVILTVATDDGNTWVIDEKKLSRSSFDKDKDYDLGFTVTRLEKNNTKIPTDQVYSLNFSGNIDFNSTVGVNVKVGNAYKYATLYQKNGSKYVAVQTVVVDKQGKAWFSLANVDKKTKYYIGINSEDADVTNAIIPDSIKKDYGMEKTSYLTDANGMQYEITGRSSSFGVSGKMFAIYVAVAIGAIILIVSIIMITINKFAKNKAKYSIANDAPPADEEPIDEEALRLKVMREMLDEKDGKSSSSEGKEKGAAEKKKSDKKDGSKKENKGSGEKKNKTDGKKSKKDGKE